MRAAYFLIRLLTAPVLLLSYSRIHRWGRVLGTAAFYLIPKFRKRALSNLALATSLRLSNSEIARYAKEAMQNLVITCLEYPKLAKETDMHRVALCENPEQADAIRKQGKGVIFFCGHQANWEVLFLEGTSRMPGVAIGRPVANNALYRWVLTIRERFGGTIIPPSQAVREGLKALKRGDFLGIVGDQGMPDSGYSSPFFGRRAWTSPLPAILARRTGCPLIVATTRRENGRYFIHYSDPLWPRQDAPAEEEIDRLMRLALAHLEKSIRDLPGEWLWQHNRWKQQTPGRIKRLYRQECLCIILPEESDALLPHLPTFREIYPLEFITVLAPQHIAPVVLLQDAEILPYKTPEETLVPDYRFKLVFNLADFPGVRAHFLALSAFAVLSLRDLRRMGGDAPLPALLKKVLLHAS
jgi:KDO2-lipid IV(A) lauroyltransferase